MRALSPPNEPDDLDARRRRIAFRASRRGTHENDLLLGGFAKRNLGAMTAEQLDDFEIILDLPDVDLFDWIAGRAPVPPEHDSPMLRRLIADAGCR
jgi:antitoxin CptB